MDEGYEAGFTPQILQTLREKNVKAIFFVTKEFYDSNPEYIKQMIDGRSHCRKSHLQPQEYAIAFT